VDVISQLIKVTIAEEVRQAGMFSVQIDTTQNISSKDQCSIILRYVTDVIHERLIALVDCESSTGQHFVGLLGKVLLNLNIDIGTCVGNSTDGAANMQGQSTLLSEHSPNQVHIWCYAHLLNLVLAETTSQWNRLKMSPLEGYVVRTASEIPQGGDEDPSMELQDVELESKTRSSCKNCVICVHLSTIF